MFKILIIGLGSAGQRHLRILIKILGKKNTEFYCLRTTKRNLIIDDNLKTKKTKSLSKYYNINDIEAKNVYDHKFEIVFITNPIYRHMHYALKFAKRGSHLFIEKPLSHNLKDTDKLIKLVKKNKIKICVGYQLRFHPGIRLLKKFLLEKKLGKLLSGTFHFGEYLPLMHKYEDYTKTHMAQKRQGGGALLCLSHEVDLVRFLLGEPKIVKSSIKKKSNLNMDVEDTVEAKLKYQKDTFINLEINFTDNPPEHFIYLKFKNGFILWDYIDKYVLYVNSKLNLKKKINFKKHSRNSMFISQAKNFLNSIKKKEKIISDINNGLKTLKLCIRLKKNGIKK